MADSFQDFYDSVEDELRKDRSWSAQTPRKRSLDEIRGGGEKEEKDLKEKQSHQAANLAGRENTLDEAIREAMELVEGCITSVFYDQ